MCGNELKKQSDVSIIIHYFQIKMFSNETITNINYTLVLYIYFTLKAYVNDIFYFTH